MSDRRHRFETLVTALLPQLYRYAFWLGGDRASAEDVVQDALLRAWRSLDALEDECKARAWLLTIVRREHARALHSFSSASSERHARSSASCTTSSALERSPPSQNAYRYSCGSSAATSVSKR